MSEPREVVEAVMWVAVGEPRDCVCGHPHFAREEYRASGRTALAPQWTYCESPSCDCRGLRRIARNGGRDG